MKTKDNIYRGLKIERLTVVQPLTPINQIQKISKLEIGKISTGKAKPTLSELLTAYQQILRGIVSGNDQRAIHQLEVNEFEIDMTIGLGGFQNNELNLKL